jgi:hypothetical protein
MKLFLLSLAGALIFNASYAQRNYIPATIVNGQNDSVKGFIDYRA